MPLREPWAESCRRLEAAISWSMGNTRLIEGSVAPDGSFLIRRPWRPATKGPSRAVTGRIVPGQPLAGLELTPAPPLLRWAAWGGLVWCVLVALAILAARVGAGSGLEAPALFLLGGADLMVLLYGALSAPDRAFLVAQLEAILEVPIAAGERRPWT